MEKPVYIFGLIVAAFMAIRYVFYRFMIIPFREEVAKERFRATLRSQAEEFERLNKEIKDAKLKYDSAKRDALNKSDRDGGVPGRNS
jgi:cell division protein FtsL